MGKRNFEFSHKYSDADRRILSLRPCRREGYMARFIKDDETAEIAWKMFEKTGSLSYYMLYKQLKK